MSRASLFAIVVSLCAAHSGYAQAALDSRAHAFPGSLWVSAATTDDAEPDNVVGQAGFEQGIVVWQQEFWFLVPYVGVGLTQDAKGYAWNDRHPSTAGIKLSRRLRNGVISAGGGLLVERDPATDRTYHPSVFAQIWTGWNGDGRAQRGRSALTFPGYAWGHSGITSGGDPGNWITSAAAQQGIRVYRVAGVAAVPFAGGAGSIDTAGRPWENKVHYEAGLKAVRTLPGAVVEGGVTLRRRHRFVANDTQTGPVAFVNLWFGWNPRKF